ncbi:MAG: dihydropteroate synthase [Caldiserica bacterium]|nr:MAG: dihydropteroate synthase [Caldisericota bacterium]
MKIMGILNVTPDSFYDGGKFFDLKKAVEKGLKMIEEGADIIDIGGESTRPGSERIDEEEEKRRVFPVIEEIRRNTDIPISIDTYKSGVAIGAIERGVNIINDISGLRFDKNMVNVLKRNKDVKVVIMHMKGEPKTMQENPFYEDVIKEIRDFFIERIEFLKENGISDDRIIIDPGIGFGKRLEDNLEIIRNIDEFKKLGYPVLIGHSRKSFIGAVLGRKNPEERFAGTIAVSLYLFKKGVDILRVHDVKETLDAIKMWEEIESEPVFQNST